MTTLNSRHNPGHILLHCSNFEHNTIFHLQNLEQKLLLKRSPKVYVIASVYMVKYSMINDKVNTHKAMKRTKLKPVRKKGRSRANGRTTVELVLS
jgi:hypothetical protein